MFLSKSGKITYKFNYSITIRAEINLKQIKCFSKKRRKFCQDL